MAKVFSLLHWVVQMRNQLRICATPKLKRLRKCASDCAIAQPTQLDLHIHGFSNPIMDELMFLANQDKFR